jgi:hypothetical protein
MYPPDWPRCVWCDRFAMDGHLTCGRSCCSESAARDYRNATRPRCATCGQPADHGATHCWRPACQQQRGCCGE